MVLINYQITIDLKKGECTMEKLLNVFASESIFSFDFFRNGLFGEKIASVLDVDGDLCRIIALILSLILAAAVLTMAAERFETAAITFLTVCILFVVIGGTEGVLAMAVLYTAAAVGIIAVFTVLRDKEIEHAAE